MYTNCILSLQQEVGHHYSCDKVDLSGFDEWVNLEDKNRLEMENRLEEVEIRVSNRSEE